MTHERIFLDTSYIQGLLNKRDKYHSKARYIFARVREASEVWTTEAVLVEAGNALSSYNRSGAARFVRGCYSTANIQLVSIDSGLLNRALKLYEERSDKKWGLTDCISFTVMEDQGLSVAASSDHHFVQAGFRAIMLGN